MKKQYSLLAILLFFAATHTKAQDVANFTFTVDPLSKNVVFKNTSTVGDGLRKAVWVFGDGTGVITAATSNAEHHYSSAGIYTVCLRIFRYSNSGDSVLTSEECKLVNIESATSNECRANFEVGNTSESLLIKLFEALPWQSNNAKPEKICWIFGDGKDTCVSYNPLLTYNYAVYHKYEHHGTYNVCIKIVYSGGCIATTCKEVHVENPEECSADFNVESTSAVNTRQFIALPKNNNEKKP
ncbi:MAG: PKD domain-containing protein, partial [Chitinophagaceae bacterium]|nr:PKD domain-containing protein [Chitinophagaceae bacterium]